MKKTKIILSALAAMSILAVIAFSGCSDPEPTYTVKYEITGPAVVATTISYANETGGREEITNVPIPWTKTITVTGKNKIVSVHVSLPYDRDSTKTYVCTIYINGKEVTHSSGSLYVSASSYTQ